MKKLFTVLFLLISLASFSQKIKLKKGDVLVDEKEWLKYKKDVFDYSILNLKGDEIIFIKYVVRGPNNQVFSKEGEPNYYQISFLGLNKKVEIRRFEKDILEILYSAKVVNEDGTLNPEKVETLVEKYGNQFSENNGNKTIIIKEEPRSGSGVNINIRR
ncbi:hypothetical protein [Flavobacterium sp.]|uniref:hypothetical protein n=1 Tax=Flavobacterium sp. TaxID=239 RepID=UPI00391DCE4A